MVISRRRLTQRGTCRVGCVRDVACHACEFDAGTRHQWPATRATETRLRLPAVGVTDRGLSHAAGRGVAVSYTRNRLRVTVVSRTDTARAAPAVTCVYIPYLGQAGIFF